MPRVPYAELIQESAVELRREEQRLRGVATQPPHSDAPLA
jgi:hypothetical protein